jgi:hypothetical protein
LQGGAGQHEKQQTQKPLGVKEAFLQEEYLHGW